MREAFDFKPASVNLGDVLISSERPIEQRFVIRPAVSLAELQVKQKEALFGVKVSHDSPNTGEFTVVVGMTSAPGLGSRQEKLSVIGRTRDGEQLPVAEIPVNFRGVGDVAIRPDLPDLGGILVGDSKTEKFSLYSRTNQPWRIRAIRIFNSPSLEYTLSGEHPQPVQSLVVRVTGLHAGRQVGHFEIEWLRESPSNGDGAGPSTGTLHVPATYFQ